MIPRESERDGLREKEREKGNLTWARFTEKFLKWSYKGKSRFGMNILYWCANPSEELY